jgi:hypothetical protein
VTLDNIGILLYVFLPPALLLGGIVGLIYASARLRAGDPWRLVAAVSLVAIAVVGLFTWSLIHACPDKYDPEDVGMCGAGGWG